MMGLQSLLAETEAAATADPLAPKSPMFPARAKRVIFLFMHGGPSSIDTFDPKPYLDANDGKPLPIKQPLTFAAGKTGGLMKSPWKFKNCGQSGCPSAICSPKIRECADDLCVVRSMVGEGVDHGAALLQTFTGTFTFTRPSMGSWVLYGLGTENRNLPGYITIKPALSHGGAKNWSSGFLPGSVQGTAIGHAGMQVAEIQKEPIEYLVNQGLNREQQRYELDMIQAINRKHQELVEIDDDLETRIQSFEMGFRMQAEAQKVFDVSGESEATKKLYGLDDPKTADFGWQCSARPPPGRSRCALHPVHPQLQVGSAYRPLSSSTTRTRPKSISPSPACLKDLKARGLLKDTLVSLVRRVRPHADFRKRQWPRSQSLRLHGLDGGRRREARLCLRRDRRVRLSCGRESHAPARPSRHNPGSHRPRSPEADLSLLRPRLPVDRYRRSRPRGHLCLDRQLQQDRSPVFPNLGPEQGLTVSYQRPPAVCRWLFAMEVTPFGGGPATVTLNPGSGQIVQADGQTSQAA
jgi:hypothetical protein